MPAHDSLHRRARTAGVNRVLYRTIRAVLQPLLDLYLRLERTSLARAVTERIWPCVELQRQWLGGAPAPRPAAPAPVAELAPAERDRRRAA